jgi:predicted CoA-binding protein
MEGSFVAVLGASDKRERYSNKAIRLLKEKGYSIVPVHPRLKVIEGLPVVHRLEEITEDVHTLTVYVGAARSKELADAMLTLHPGRVIFNPGAENPELESALTAQGIEVCRACTLVMLQTGQF